MKRAVIIGGGAAGLCCADALSKGGLAVTVFEQNDRVGKKLLSTGNGRCNLTNLNAGPAAYSAPDFVAPALTRYPPKQVLAFFESLSLFAHADEAGRVYPLSNQAASVLDALRLDAARAGVEVRTGVTVTDLRKKDGAWYVNGERFDFAVLACGGKAAVKAYNAFDLLRGPGIPVTETAPGLVKLTTSDPAAKQLKGIRAPVRLTLFSGDAELAAAAGELLFGDGVLSGIAAMDLSSFVNREKLRGENALPVDDERRFARASFRNREQRAAGDGGASSVGLSAEGDRTGPFEKGGDRCEPRDFDADYAGAGRSDRAVQGLRLPCDGNEIVPRRADHARRRGLRGVRPRDTGIKNEPPVLLYR